jgi:RNA polymerase sigma-70 factor (ECF subfamily)
MSRIPAHEALFKAWLETHRGILFKIARSFGRNATEMEELSLELQLALWNSIPGFLGKAKESTWIYRVCLNTALSWRRSADRRNVKYQPGVDLTSIAAQGFSPADDAGQRELLERLYEAIHGMDDFERVLVLLLLDGMAYREIAEVTGLSEGNVGVSLTRARQRLSILMKGVTDELK